MKRKHLEAIVRERLRDKGRPVWFKAEPARDVRWVINERLWAGDVARAYGNIFRSVLTRRDNRIILE